MASQRQGGGTAEDGGPALAASPSSPAGRSGLGVKGKVTPLQRPMNGKNILNSILANARHHRLNGGPAIRRVRGVSDGK